MSKATLKALISIVLSSSAIPRIHFRIQGYTVTPEGFARLKAAVKNDEVNAKIDDAYLSGGSASAAYNGRTDTMILHSSMLKSTALSQDSRASIIHECLHAVLDMDSFDSLSPYQEETCSILVSNIYVLHHFGTPYFSANGNTTQLTRRISANPGMDITNDPLFLAAYEQVAQLYQHNDPDYGKKRGLHNGLRKRL